MNWPVATIAACLTAAGATILSIPAPKDPIVLESRFDDTWDDVMQTAKATAIRVIALDPKPVITERIVPDPPVVVPPVVMAVEEDKPAVRYSRRHARQDICRGKGKRYINGGRSWRCRR